MQEEYKKYCKYHFTNFVLIIIIQPFLINAANRTALRTAPVAQLDRVFGYEPKGRAFESLRVRHQEKFLSAPIV